jgi:hypothetical protein
MKARVANAGQEDRVFAPEEPQRPPLRSGRAVGCSRSGCRWRRRAVGGRHYRVTDMLLKPLQVQDALASSILSRLTRGAVVALAGVAAAAALPACDLPFGLGTPSTRALESGAEASLSASSFEIKGTFVEPGFYSAPSSGARTNPPSSTTTWSIDLQEIRPNTEHVVISGADVKIEAIVVLDVAYFRGQAFLSDHMGGDPISRAFVAAAGNAWWRGSAALAPQLPDFTDAKTFRTTFLGPTVTQRTDHVTVDGIDAVELSGPRADVFIASAPPYGLVRVHLAPRVLIDGMTSADLRYGNFTADFGVVAPTDVIDFSNLSTLPPIYTVVSVDTSGCGSPCVVSAVVKNLGGKTGASGPSTVTFTMTAAATRSVLGTCQAQVTPDVGYNATTTAGCTINLTGQPSNAAIVTAAATNPGHA